MESPANPSIREYMRRWALGYRPGLQTGLAAIEHVSNSAWRKPTNWILPGLLFAAFFVGIILFYADTVTSSWGGLEAYSTRIIFFDYLIFLLGWLCGWNAAGKWRRNQDFMEELVLTPLRPSVIGQLLVRGHIRIWIPLLLIGSVADLLFFGLHESVVVLRETPREFLPVAWFVFAFKLLLGAVFALVLAWFHLQTLHLAYWMFASAAIPRVRLAGIAAANFFLIPVYVLALTLTGMAISGACGLLLSLIFLPFSADSDFASWPIWTAAAIPGLVLVGALKKLIIREYEFSFWKNYFLFVWWGAGERSQPLIYPVEFIVQANQWVRYLRQEELLNAKSAASAAQPSAGTSNPPA